MPILDSQAFHVDFAAALAFATRLHARQVRKDTDIPYISHLIAVAGLVLEHEGNRDQAIAALLHDSIEDQVGEYPGGLEALREDIRRQFGSEVLKIVEGCTDSTTVPKPPWRERKERYIAHLANVSDEIRLVSCADKLHNARAIVSDLRVMGNRLWSRFTGGQDNSLWYYRSLADEFLRRGPQRVAEEFDRTVSKMESLAKSGS